MDKYDFSQPSPGGSPGFESFRSEKNRKYYFHFNDSDGRPLLFSQGYSSTNDRDNGLQSTRENALLPDGVRTKKTKDGFFFVVKARNNQEVARSRSFESGEKMEKALGELVKALPQPASPPAKPPKQKKSTEKSLAPGKQETSAKPVLPASQRFNFVLTFYRQSVSAPLRGKIEFPLNKEKATFSGVDLKAIQAFLEGHLPAAAVTGKPAASTTEKKRPSFRPASRNRLKILTPRGELERNSFGHEEQLTVEFETGKNPLVKRYTAKVFARSLDDNLALLLGEKAGKLPPEGWLSVPILTSILEPGTYRLEGQLSYETNGEQLTKSGGSRLVQVF